MIDIEQNKKTQNEKRNQPLIIEFYNLQLQSGPKYDFSIASDTFFKRLSYKDLFEPLYEELEEQGKITVDKIYPDKAEQNRILSFLEENIPELENRFGLKWYKEQTELSWFESKHFLRFADEYNHVKQLINEYMTSKVSNETLEWLDYKLGSFKLGLRLISMDGKEAFRIFPPDNMIAKHWDLNNYKIDSFITTIINTDRSGMTYFGINIDRLVAQLIEELAEMMIMRYEIVRCQLKGCNKIFEIKPGGYPQKYCSDAHKAKAYRERKNKLILV